MTKGNKGKWEVVCIEKAVQYTYSCSPAMGSSELDKPSEGEPAPSAANTERRNSSGSIAEDDTEIPWLEFRWMHGGAQHMDLPTAPITTQTINYVPFSASENIRLEEAYQKLSEEEKTEVGRISGKGSEAADKEKEKKKKAADTTQEASKTSGPTAGKEPAHTTDHVKIEKANGEIGDEHGDVPGPDDIEVEKYPDPGNESPADWNDHKAKEDHDKQEEELDTVVGVTVSQVSEAFGPPSCSITDTYHLQDSLFEVSIPTMSLNPVFWAHTGKRVPVIRATWFINDDSHPCEWELAEELEKGYQYVCIVWTAIHTEIFVYQRDQALALVISRRAAQGD